jgi:protein gp37
MQRTKISYLTHTWSPIAMKCTPVSEGCVNCWSIALNKRFKNKPDKPELKEKELEAPLKLRKPARIGVQFMGDLWHNDVPNDYIFKIFDIIRMCPQHIFIVLTKRIERLAKAFSNPLPPNPNKIFSAICGFDEIPWPLPNLYLGVTCENQKTADERIPILLQIPAAVRFLSLEPLLEDIDLKLDYGIKTDCYGEREPKYIDWVIVGCESGPKRRPCKLEWVRNIVAQCQSAGVAVFVKQLDINGRVKHDINKFPEDLRIQEYVKWILKKQKKY